VTKEQYNEWRNHPATLFFRKFIHDRRESLIRQATELWLNAPDVFEKEQHEDRGRIAELFLVEDVPFEAIEAFYKEQEDAAQIAETVSG
jgi:hypothetical protein